MKKKDSYPRAAGISPRSRFSSRSQVCWRSRLIQVSPVAKSRSTQTSLPNSRLSWSSQFSTSQSIRWHHLVAGQFEIGGGFPGAEFPQSQFVLCLSAKANGGAIRFRVWQGHPEASLHFIDDSALCATQHPSLSS